MKPARYIVGVDLGTTNSALAYVDLQAGGDVAGAIQCLELVQLVAPGECASRKLLPSNAYLPGEHELPQGATRLPWGASAVVVGELAKAQGARVPGRMVSSAKSWLCHPGVDRTAPILPWGAPEGVERRSPVEATALYLRHLKDAWAHRFPEAPLAEQELVLTVPASFDEVARELTVRAAKEAGLERLTLLEEPQAAFYDFTARHRGRLQEALGGHRLILVCDVGGGTTDLTLIHAEVDGGAPRLKRIAVGDHILLGGDNMDVALARRVEARLGARLDAAQWSMLVQSCRLAKESLLGGAGPERTRVSVVGRGSKLVGSALSAELDRAEVLSVVLDGFFPRTTSGELPARGGRAGLMEFGLPYASEPAVTRHVAAFLRGHAAEVDEALGTSCGGLPRPDAVLLNGGVFTPHAVAERLLEVVSAWYPGQPPVALLEADALELAVARGAAFYGLVRRGLGLRIGGGTARGYFVEVGAPGEARRALCVLPRHVDERAEVEVPRTFALAVDRPVRFALWASALSSAKEPGELVSLDEEAFQPLPPIETVLDSGAAPKKGVATREVPVRLRAALTELGTLELWCVAEEGAQRWKLEFQLRGGAQELAPSSVAAMPRRFDEAKELVELVYGKRPAPVDKAQVKNLVRNLEKVLGPRDGWSTPLIRELWSALYAGQQKRRRTADHERLFFSLLGYCLRPGFGAPLDAWRASETFKLFEAGLQFQNEPHNWDAWWVLWRRIAGGLDGAAQERLFQTLAPLLRPPSGKSASKAKVLKVEGVPELIRLMASLERLEVAEKMELGGIVLERVARLGPSAHDLWALGRLGARVPFAGSGHACVSPQVAVEWLERLLRVEPKRPEELAFPLAQLARVSGDRARDLEDPVRERVAERLRALRAPEALVKMVLELTELGEREEQRVFGESLPAGLRLLEAET